MLHLDPFYTFYPSATSCTVVLIWTLTIYVINSHITSTHISHHHGSHHHGSHLQPGYTPMILVLLNIHALPA